MKRIISLLIPLFLVSCTFSASSFVCESDETKEGSRCVEGVWVLSDSGSGPDQGRDGGSDTGLPKDMKSRDDVDVRDMSSDLGGSDMVGDLPIATCGNDILDSGETCDDGNVIPNDGCDELCQIEATICGNGVLEVGEACDDGEVAATGFCNADCSALVGVNCKTVANNGRDYLFCRDPVVSVDASTACQGLGYELALMRDPADLTFWAAEGVTEVSWWIDGSDDLRPFNWGRFDGPNMPFFADFDFIQTGLNCASFSSGLALREPAVCGETKPYICEQRFCGNGTVDAGESCDDGNVNDWDGCNSLCELEVGFDCEVSLAPRVETICRQCGDGERSGSETCDDGNDFFGDGCDSTCQVEPNFQCSGYAPDVSCNAAGAIVTGYGRNASATSLPEFGIVVGVPLSAGCANGFMIGVYVQVTAMRIFGIRGICGEIDVRKNIVDVNNVLAIPIRYGVLDVPEQGFFCPEGQFIVGYQGYTNASGQPSGMDLYCAPIEENGTDLQTGASAAAGSVGETGINVTQDLLQLCDPQASAITTWTIRNTSLGGRCRSFRALCSSPDSCN